MGKSEKVKENVIETTIDLLKKSNGNIDNITIRNIAEIVGVSTGLVNYHFESKEKLIELCVQKIIQNVIMAFRPQFHEDMKAADRLGETAKQVMDFLLANPEISKISILGDLAVPKLLDNTMKTVIGFMSVMGEKQEHTKMLTYCFTLILQGTFLRKNTTKETLGFDFNNKEERDSFIDFVVNKLYGKSSDETVDD